MSLVLSSLWIITVKIGITSLIYVTGFTVLCYCTVLNKYTIFL